MKNLPLGGAKSQKILPVQGKASKIAVEESQDCPKEAESCPQMDPREAKGTQMTASMIILKAKSIQKHNKIFRTGANRLKI